MSDEADCLITHFFYLTFDNSVSTASSMLAQLPSNLMNALPMMQPREWSAAARKVYLLLTPKPTSVGFFKFIDSIFLKYCCLASLKDC